MPTLAIQPGATIFVTGVNGLIGSHVADQLLKRGYNVRGAVRDVEKSKWLSEYFEGKYKDAKFELVSVPDMSVEGCYDEVVKGTSGFVQVASPLFGEDPNISVPIGINAALNALKASAKNPSIKRVVYTSSSIAATLASPGVEKVLDQTTFNEEGLAKGWNFPEDEPAYKKGIFTYAAIKTASEKACWEWIKENKPGFVFNTILPNINLGSVLVPEKQGTPSSIAFGRVFFHNEGSTGIYTKLIEPQWFISNVDCALLHISALIYDEPSSERIFGFAENFDFNKLLAIYRKLYPDRTFPEDIPGLVPDESKMPRDRAEEVLKWIKDGGKGWDTLEEAAKEMTEQFV